MHIWIVNHYSSTESKDGTNARHAWLATNLESNGWTASLITASVSHPSGIQRLRGFRMKFFERGPHFDSLWVRVPAYSGNGLRRVLGMWIFASLILVPGFLKPLKKPDIVLGSTVHFFAAFSGLVLARRWKVPFVYEVRDVWPDTLVDLGKIKKGSVIARAMHFVSKFLAQRAALVVSPLPGVADYVSDLGARGVPSLWVPNGAERSLLLKVAPIPSTKPFVFMYLGSHGNTNELELLVDAFDHMCRLHPELKVRLRIIGDGPRKKLLSERISQLESTHLISMEPRVTRTSALKASQDAHCMILTAKPLGVYRYGMSPNKLFDYLLSGRPVIMSEVDPTHPISSIGAGVEVPPNDIAQLADAMYRVSSLPKSEISRMGALGRKAAEGVYSYREQAKVLSRALNAVIADSNL